MGIAPLQASGLRGQGARVALVGEAPTSAGDLGAFRSCFGIGAFEQRPWWQPSSLPGASRKRVVPDIAAFADESPGYPIICSSGVQSCPAGGQALTFVGGTSASTPLVAGMIALWHQQAADQGLPRPGFVPPLLYRIAQRRPTAFADVTQGTNALFGGLCCAATPGYDLATGWGSPFANAVAGLLASRG